MTWAEDKLLTIQQNGRYLERYVEEFLYVSHLILRLMPASGWDWMMIIYLDSCLLVMSLIYMVQISLLM